MLIEIDNKILLLKLHKQKPLWRVLNTIRKSGATTAERHRLNSQTAKITLQLLRHVLIKVKKMLEKC